MKVFKKKTSSCTTVGMYQDIDRSRKKKREEIEKKLGIQIPGVQQVDSPIAQLVRALH